MPTREIPILGASTSPDASGDVFPSPLEASLTLSTAVFDTLLGPFEMVEPTGADVAILGKFNVPQEYVGTPKIVIRGVLAQVANTLGFGFKKVAVADSETIDVAWGTEQLASNATWTGYAVNDMYEEIIDLTAGDYSIGDEVFYSFFRDETVDTQTASFILTGLFFRFNDA